MKTQHFFPVIFAIVLYAETSVVAQNWHWAQHCGGANFDNTNAVCVDNAGNSYFGGRYWTPSAIFGQDTLPCGGTYNLFITKLDVAGNFLWTRTAGGFNTQGGAQDFYDLYFDSNSNSIVITGTITGYTQSIASCSLGDIGGVFLAKIDAEGNCLWAYKVNHSDASYSLQLYPTSNGNIMMAGRNRYDCYYPGLGTLQAGGFIAEFQSENGTIKWGRKIVDENAYIGDIVYRNNSLLTSGGSDVNTMVIDGKTIPCQGKDAFIARFDTTGHLVWVKTFGGPEDDLGATIGTDTSGNIYTCGIFKGTAQFGKISLQNGDRKDVFLAKFDENGEVLWARQLKLTGELYTVHHYTSSAGETWLNGTFSGTATFGEQVITAETGIEMFVAKYNSSGTFIDVIHSSNSYNHAFATNEQQELFVAGSFNGTSYFGDKKLISYGSRDGFFARHDAITGLPKP
ncbi:MAG TPA: hypothetical protein PKG48_05880, partial [Bacteroidales bacterium]|nr:hypothetical protein [Bacteroidales bacterium]